VRWETKWSFDGKLRQKYLHQKLSKFVNWFSSYGRKRQGCFFETQCISMAFGIVSSRLAIMRSKDKFGLRSGNTFRFGGKLSATKSLRHSRDQHVVVKTIVDDSLTTGAIDFRQFADGVGETWPRDACRQRLAALASRLVPDGDLPFDTWQPPGDSMHRYFSSDVNNTYFKIKTKTKTSFLSRSRFEIKTLVARSRLYYNITCIMQFLSVYLHQINLCR